ncbi:MAG: NADH-quinone oxidoreductase subunit C [Desulfobacterota bacterium]|nr:NADH-quinone oxidoreductase subunit C [Thermodesulfobacteriota bacterium]
MTFETISKLMENLRSQFPEEIVSFREPVPKKVYIEIKAAAILKIGEYLFRTLGARFNTIVGVDRRPTCQDFQTTHIFSLDKDKIFVLLQSSLDKDSPEIDSLTSIIPGANWAEREIQDLLGIKVKGHKDPRRLALPDDWPENLHPLRRDFVYNFRPEPVTGAAPKPVEPPENAAVVPIGPFYPVLEEPAVFRIFVEGETVVGCDYRGFYNHRGIEKIAESALTYNKISFLAERI